MDGEQKWYFKWWTVIAGLLTLGPFAFPLLWKSKDFNLFWKWVLTVTITGITVVLLWSTWKIVAIVLEHFRSLGLI